ncbi:MAG: YczE/YyaS/YitT family protein [Cetobacterium sp.]|uniref:YczE/YyaS/YitT family protein n=1 Tax=Cetobacterium sp. TaxID=2071632 RepID=UPI003F3137CA
MERTKLIKCCYYVLGIIFLGFGITLTLISNLGAGGWDVLIQNLSNITSITVGKCLWSVAIILLLISGVILKKIPDIKVLAVSWITGIVIDISYYIILKNLIINSLYLRGIILILGLLCIALGCSMMFVTNLPKNHTETLVFSIVDKFGYSYKTIKIFLDSLALFIAIGIGIFLKDFSNLGVGTFISSFFMGYLIDRFLPVTKKIFIFLQENFI